MKLCQSKQADLLFSASLIFSVSGTSISHQFGQKVKKKLPCKQSGKYQLKQRKGPNMCSQPDTLKTHAQHQLVD